MTFQHIGWLYLMVPLLALLVVLRVWRRHYWGHSLVEQLAPRLGRPNLVFRLPTVLEGLAVGFLLVALLGPVYPFVLRRIERGGLQIMFVVDLSQSMEEGLQKGSPLPPPKPASNPAQPGAVIRPGSKMEAVKASAVEFVRKRPGDAIGVVVFSNNAYLVTPATFDHDSLGDYLQMVNTQTLVNEGFTAIGEGIMMASQFFDFNKRKGDRRAKGQVIILFSDGDYNYGRDPLKEIEKARYAGTHIYFIGVALEQGASQQIRESVPNTGGKFFDVNNPKHLEEAFGEINQLEKGRFYATELVRHQPAYFIFALLSFLALTVRMVINAIPHFVEIS
ncbi:MAG: VWA domain-containing protein [Acidobacteria bacterium]|nr:VWA domain-containing protein [Acidobacteriota bacterium]